MREMEPQKLFLSIPGIDGDVRAVEVPLDVRQMGGAEPLSRSCSALPLPVQEHELGQTCLRVVDPDEGVHDLVRVQVVLQLIQAVRPGGQKLEREGGSLVAEESPVDAAVGIANLPPSFLKWFSSEH